MRFIKKNIKIIIGIIFGIILVSGITVFADTASNTFSASSVKYTRNNTEVNLSDALDDLYNRTPSGSKTLLWTNSSPSSSFAGKTINLSSSLTQFSHILIQYYIDTSSTSQVYEDIFKINPIRPSTVQKKALFELGSSASNR